MRQWLAKRLRRLPVRKLRASKSASGVSRVEWEIIGIPLWFESHDAVLSDEPEAFACLCSGVASLSGRKVGFPERICPRLSSNLAEIETIWNEWWRTSTGRFKAPSKPAVAAGNPGESVATFLSLGVDSFYTALHEPQVRTLIYVGGYDIPIADTPRLEEIESRLRDVGERLGKRVIMLRTNLRQHPAFGRLNWEKFHGAALAAAAHLLRGAIDEALVSSSFPASFFSPWGTSWKTDHLWSSSSLSLRHVGQEFWRFEKLEKIAGHPEAQDHLHVCWERRNSGFNCGCCEKCQRTMLGLLALGCLDQFKTLPGEENLAESLRHSRPLAPRIWPTYQSFLDRGLPPAVATEVKALLERSDETHQPNI